MWTQVIKYLHIKGNGVKPCPPMLYTDVEYVNNWCYFFTQRILTCFKWRAKDSNGDHLTILNFPDLLKTRTHKNT